MSSEDAQTGTGHVAFYVKDAPSDDFSSVFVEFTRVEVHQAGGDEAANETTSPAPTGNTTSAPNATTPTNATASPTNASEAAEPKSGWIVIVNSTQSVDLKQFQGDARAFLGGSNISSGKYTQIRIHVDRAWGVVNNTTVNLSLPSGTLKIVRPWTVEAGKETRLIVDFDLEKSLSQSGNGQYRLKPVLKLSVEQGDKSEQGDDGEDARDNRTKPANTRTGNARP